MKKSQLRQIRKIIKEAIQEQRGRNNSNVTEDQLTNVIMRTPPGRWPEEVRKPFAQWWNDNISAFMDLVMVDFDQFINDNT